MNPATFRKLAALGLTTEQVAGVLEIMSSDAEERNEKARARWRKWKANQPANVGKRLANVGKQLTRGVDSSSKKVITEEDKKDAPKARVSDLDAFKAELSPLLDAERIEAVVKLRRTKRGQLTALAAKLFIADADACGLSLADAADTCISRNWITVKPEYFKGRNQQSTAPPKKVTHANMWTEDAIAMGIIDDPAKPKTRHLEPGLARGQNQGTGLARRIASA